MDRDVDRQREVADELLDDGDLLGVLLAERRDVRLHHVEQNETDRRDTVEVPGPVRAFVSFGRSAHPDDRGVARRVDLLDRRHEQDIDAGLGADRGVLRLLPWIAREIDGVVELLRVDEQTGDQPVGVRRARAQQREVSVVQARPSSAPARSGRRDAAQALAQFKHRPNDNHRVVASTSTR